MTLVAPGPVSITLAVVIVSGSIASLKVALTVWLMPTPVAALTGTVELTAGEVLGGGGDCRRVGRQRRQSGSWRERRGDARVTHGARDRRHALLQGEAGGADRQRIHRLAEGGGELPADGHTG